MLRSNRGMTKDFIGQIANVEFLERNKNIPHFRKKILANAINFYTVFIRYSFFCVSILLSTL